jgi:intracellular septation protein
MSAARDDRMHPLVKLATELGPLVVFFFANSRFGIFTATAVFMVATVVALSVSYAINRRLAVLPMVTGVFVMVFGGLTIWLNDDLFIKLKPTIVNTLFGVILLGGLAMGRPLLQVVLDSVIELTDEGWRKLTFRWGLFFLFLAVLNEVVWRNVPTDTWVSFKVFGIMPITMVFALSQMRLLIRYRRQDTAGEDG